MSGKISFVLLLFILLLNSAFAQVGKNEIEIYNAYLNNVKDSCLATGFYKISLKSLYIYEDYKFNIEYNQKIKDVEVEKHFMFFKHKVKYHHVHSESYTDKKIKDKFIYNLIGTNVYYQINPFPIALKNNIIRIYDCSIKSYDSTYSSLGLTLKLDFCADFSVLNRYNTYNSDLVGLVVDNQLIFIADNYFKEETIDHNKRFDRYFVLCIPKNNSNNIDYYKKILYKQTLFKK
jgi:hypothetical protein